MTMKATAALVAVWMVLGVLGTLAVQAERQPHCPTEDSCAVSYENGKWTITEVTQ